MLDFHSSPPLPVPIAIVVVEPAVWNALLAIQAPEHLAWSVVLQVHRVDAVHTVCDDWPRSRGAGQDSARSCARKVDGRGRSPQHLVGLAQLCMLAIATVPSDLKVLTE